MKPQFFWGIIVCCFAAVIRLLYAMHSPLYMTTGDSVSYSLTAKHIIQTKQLVDPFRTPIYPLILAAPYVLMNSTVPDEISGVYSVGLHAVRIVQSLVMIASAVLLFILLTRIGISAPMSALLSVLGTSDYVILLLEHTILTESFAVSWLVLVTYCTHILIRKFSAKTLGLLVLFWIIGVFLRPSFIAIPLLCVFVIWLRHRTARVMLLCFFALSVYGGIITVYSSVNSVQHGVRGISRIQDINIWGKLLHMNVKDTVLGSSEIADMARSARLVNRTHPFEIFRQFPILYQKKYAMLFHAFTSEVLHKSFGMFVLDSFLSIPTVISSPTDLQDITAKTGKFDELFTFLKWFYEILMYVAYISLFSLPFMVYFAWKKNTVELGTHIFISLVGVYHISIVAFLSYNDFGRLMSVGRPFLLVSAYYALVQIKRRYL